MNLLDWWRWQVHDEPDRSDAPVCLLRHRVPLSMAEFGHRFRCQEQRECPFKRVRAGQRYCTCTKMWLDDLYVRRG